MAINEHYLKIVEMTEEERFNMYMSRPKEELARMLAHRDTLDDIIKQPPMVAKNTRKFLYSKEVLPDGSILTSASTND